MDSLLSPFTGFIPSHDHARRIVGPPTSMLTAEQKNASRDDELSFRHVVGRGAGAPHSTAMNWLARCHELDALQPVESSVIVHRLQRGDFTATGLIADVSLAAYDAGLVKRHEATIAKTERKMIDYMQSTRIFGNPVALAHKDHAGVANSLARHARRPTDLSFESIDGTHHSLWIVGGDAAHDLCAKLTDVLYVTDGHHRLAGAASLAAAEGRPNAYIPAGVFAENELQVSAFARVITHSPADTADIGAAQIDRGAIVKAMGEKFDLEEVEQVVPRPTGRHQIGVRIDRRSYLLTIPDGCIPTNDPYDRLDVNLLQDLVLEPLFGVTNQRTDPRLSFIADTADEAHVAQTIDSYDAWFLPFPTSVNDVMHVADAGQTMPPKSTYFLPKPPSGIVIRTIDTD